MGGFCLALTATSQTHKSPSVCGTQPSLHQTLENVNTFRSLFCTFNGHHVKHKMFIGTLVSWFPARNNTRKPDIFNRPLDPQRERVLNVILVNWFPFLFTREIKSDPTCL